MKKALIFSSLMFVLPVIALAQTGAQGDTTQGLLGLLNSAALIINRLIPLLIAATLVVFFWGLVTFVAQKGAEGASAGRGIMMAGLVALFVMVSVWGIIRLAQQTLGVDNQSPIPAPKVQY